MLMAITIHTLQQLYDKIILIQLLYDKGQMLSIFLLMKNV